MTPGLTEVLRGEKFCLLTWFQFKEDPEDYAQQMRDLPCCSVAVSWSYILITTN